MKLKILICIICALTSAIAYAQEYKKFKVNLVLGGASINKAGGPVLSLEPAFRLNDKFALGFKLEETFILGGTDVPALIGSQSINGQYYFSNEAVRPFVGVGLGLYNMSNNGFICDCESSYEKNKIGFYPSVGFDYGHFTFKVEYNYMTPVKIVTKSIFSNSSNGSVTYENASYFSTKIGLSIGGGKKK